MSAESDIASPDVIVACYRPSSCRPYCFVGRLNKRLDDRLEAFGYAGFEGRRDVLCGGHTVIDRRRKIF